MGPNNSIGYLLQHISEVLAKQSDQVLQERLGIGLSQYKLLIVLEQHPYLRQNEIAGQLGQTEASISRQIKIMQAKGLLQRAANPNSKRERIAALTSQGLRVTAEANKILNSYHAPVFESLSLKQQKQLHEALIYMHQQTCQLGRVGTCTHDLE